MQARLHHKAAAETREAQDAEKCRLRDEQRIAAQRVREQKQLLCDQQDHQRWLDRQAPRCGWYACTFTLRGGSQGEASSRVGRA